MEVIPDRADLVFLLWHRRSTGVGLSDSKLLGVFSTRERAIAEISTFRDVEGFVDHPDGFSVELIPADQVIFDTEKFGFEDLIRQSLGASRVTVDDWAGPLVEIIESGSEAVFSIVESIHEHIPNPSEAEVTVARLMDRWLPNRWMHEPDPDWRLEDMDQIARDFWACRRAGYPAEPAWESPSHLAWKQEWTAYRKVLLLESVSDVDGVLESVMALAGTAASQSDFDYLAHYLGLIATSLHPLGSDVISALAERRFAGRDDLLAAIKALDRKRETP